MKRFKLPLMLVILLSSIGLFSMLPMGTPENQPKSSIDHKVDSLLALMTLEEKIGQLNMYNGSWEFTGPVPADGNSQAKSEQIKKGHVGGMLNVLTAEGTKEAQRMAVENSRLGIPLIFGYDVVHGYKTMMPIPLAQAASWDAEGAKKGSAIAAKEAAASGITWTFAPMIDISRDARWGRIMESAGEDPYLTSVMAKAWIDGFQGDDLNDLFTIAACAKHFAAYGFAEAGRDYNTVDISNQTLYNVVLPPFKAASDAGVASVMNAFNDVNGTPATGNAFLQRDILKGKWGFKGFVVSDWASIAELITHGAAPDAATAGEMALNAGSDMDMEAHVYENEGKKLVEEGRVAEKLVDDAVKRILRIKFQLGLFDDPYRYSDAAREKASVLTPENLAASREVARKTMVLLKNDNQLLPLNNKLKSVAVIGQLANSKDVPLGSWRAQAIANSGISLLEGIQQRLDKTAKVTFAQGYTLTEGSRTFVHELTFANDDGSGFAEAIAAAKSAEVVIMAMGEDCFQSGEGRSQLDIQLKGRQVELLEKICAVNKNVVVVLMNGRPLAIPEVEKTAPAILESWFAGSEAGHAIADVLFGDYNPSGKLPVSFPHHSGQEPLYYNHKNTGRPQTNEFDAGMVFWSHYTDGPKEALYPFGYGLSYANFSYKDLKVTATKGAVAVNVTITNTGAMAGKETAQLYIRDVFASETQPVKRLVAFEQVLLQAGESKTLSFTLTQEQLGFFTSTGNFVAEDGEFHLMIGSNSRDVLKEAVKVQF